MRTFGNARESESIHDGVTVEDGKKLQYWHCSRIEYHSTGHADASEFDTRLSNFFCWSRKCNRYVCGYVSFWSSTANKQLSSHTACQYGITEGSIPTNVGQRERSQILNGQCLGQNFKCHLSSTAAPSLYAGPFTIKISLIQRKNLTVEYWFGTALRVP